MVRDLTLVGPDPVASFSTLVHVFELERRKSGKTASTRAVETGRNTINTMWSTRRTALARAALGGSFGNERSNPTFLSMIRLFLVSGSLGHGTKVSIPPPARLHPRQKCVG